MLPLGIQERLVDYYASSQTERIKKGFQIQFLEGIQGFDVDKDREAHSAAIYLDIAGFSGIVAGMNASQVRRYLDLYYQKTIGPLFEAGGMIDRIAGDGIVAVFSTVFDPDKSPLELEDAAFDTARSLVRSLSGTSFAAKAAVTTGKLLFCKTGVAEVWEEVTVIGPPLTELYRIEEKAQRDEVCVRGDSALGKRVWAAVRMQDEHRRQVRTRITGAHWSVVERDEVLRGVNDGVPVPLVVQTWVPHAPR